MYPSILSLRLLCSPLKPSISLAKRPRPLFNVLLSSSSPGRRRSPPPQSGDHLPFGLRTRRGSTSSAPPPLDDEGGGEKHKRAPMEDTNMKRDGFVFNKKRAEGKDETNKKNLRLKVRKLNPNTISYVQILGTGMDTQDTSPSVLLFFDKQRFIFNAGEGLQRFCTEHKIKLSKIDHIFLSRVSSETAGGIPGLLLTLAGTGEEGLSVNIWGPSDLNYLVDAMKSFIPHAAMVHTRSFGTNADALRNANEDMDPIVLVEDEVVKISAILLKPKSSEGSARKPGEISVLYLCELPDIAGKFDPEKAKALGLRPGKKYGELQSGKSVMSDSQSIMVHPRDVMDPPVPGPVVLLVDCPTEFHLQDLLSKQYLNVYYPDFCRDIPEGVKSVSCIIHLSPVSVTSAPDYQEWMKRFGSAQHIMAGHEKKHMEVPIMMSSTRIGTRLNYLCPQFFPAPGFWSLKNIARSTKSKSLTEDHVSELCNSTSAENLLKFTLRPHGQLGLDNSKIPSRMTLSGIVDELLREIPEIVDAARSIRKFWRGSRESKVEPVLLQNGSSMIEEPWLEEKTPTQFLESVEKDVLGMEPWSEENSLPHCLESVRRDDLEIVLLGTGSSQPSKYRNVSSIFINLFTRGGMLLDCGEGTLGQLKRRYGVEGADEAVRNLTCIWISHIHADHHAGLARILALRRDLLTNVPHEPLLVVGPRQLKRYLDAYQRLEDLDMQFIDCWSTSKESWRTFDMSGELTTNGSSPPESSTLFAKEGRMQSFWKRPGNPTGNNQALPALKSVLAAAGLDTLISFPVVHCPQAFGVALKASERTNRTGKLIPGWKIVYSGDTRPCPELVEASRGATVLIHEATFDDALAEEALARNHSTTKEAIEVGEAAGAYRIILTHFSQRYPKVPVLDKAHMHNTCIAFDMMSVNIADLPVLPKVVPYLKLLFRDELAVDESDDVVDIASELS